MRVIFLHVDRTGGMALRELLAAQFHQHDIRPVPHDTRANVRISNYPIDPCPYLIAQNQRFVDEGHDLVMGHWDYDIVHRIADRRTLITVLRDPAERAASLWRFIRKERGMYGELSDQASQMGMMPFLLKHRSLWADVMVRQMAGVRWTRPNERTGAAHIAQALRNLQAMDYVGVTERLGEFASWLCEEEGWSGQIDHINETTGDTINDWDRETLYKETPGDYGLYRLARRRCEHDLHLHPAPLQ